MKKLALAALMTAFLVCACKEVPDNPENDLTIGLEGWEISKSTYDFDINPRDIYFVNENIGFVVGYNGNIFKTTDAGTTWRKQNSGTILHLHSVYFIDENVGFVSGNAMSECLDADCGKGSVLLKTINGGDTWTKTFFPDYIRILSLKFFNPLNGIAIIHKPDLPNSRDEYVATTSDGGSNWNLLDLQIKPYSGSLYFVDNIAFVSGENNQIFKSTDRGQTWQTISTPIESNYDIRNVYFYNENIGYIDGISHIYKTIDGGLNWEETNFPFTYFGTFHFSSENEGFNIQVITVYDGGDFPTFKGSISYETLDGGITWTKSELMKSLYLGMTFFPRKDLGYGFNFSEFSIIKKKE
jgi:photosystem II stability/assembly factor-like uncharacterized protein